MRKINLIIFLIITASVNSIFPSIPKAATPSMLAQEALDTLPKKGFLKQTSEGFIYVSVDDDYIFDLIKFFPDFLPPPYYRKGGIGAHISLVSAEEYECKLKDREIHQLGQKVHFQPDGFYTVKSDRPGEEKTYLYLKVTSSDLENIRKSYDLPPELNGHDFHITIGYKIYPVKEGSLR